VAAAAAAAAGSLAAAAAAEGAAAPLLPWLRLQLRMLLLLLPSLVLRQGGVAPCRLAPLQEEEQQTGRHEDALRCLRVTRTTQTLHAPQRKTCIATDGRINPIITFEVQP
jgi:hypothetical protein